MMLLFYAGMAIDQCTEQIGLAHSEDGLRFSRVGANGLLIGRDASIEWKDTRVCNPCVFEDGGKYRMLYQGVGWGGSRYSIGHAQSEDGYKWTLDEEACLGWPTMGNPFDTDPGYRSGPIEPHVLKDNGMFKVWFNFRSAEVTQNRFYYAETYDFRSWDIRPTPILDGRDFLGSTIWYPQVIFKNGEYHLYFMVRGNGHAIYRCRSKDGIAFGVPEHVLGTFIDFAVLGNLRLGSRLNKRVLFPLLRKASAVGHRLSLGLGRKSVPIGVGHPQRIEVGSRKLMFVHRYHVNSSSRAYMDIALYEQSADSWVFRGTALLPSKNQEDWDAFFVADPYALILSSKESYS